ncbi:hypothetical protein GCM10023170_049620 [Phytohabitans houttuyneae]|uniref:Uncharacterized protein n=2 Tax=Phytohabitans houttuyneae TaxID=1076126 RepID=A0A6V8KMG0_9ACTN|nr:hypothetical protein Phou_092240 [Phytohabitans houttuyneae]
MVAAPASAGSGPLSIRSIAFAERHVDTTADAVVVALDFTIKNTNAAAEHLAGEVSVRLAGTAPGTFVGQTHEILFQYGQTGYDHADWISGTPQLSSYRYSFVVPRYANARHARWVVTAVTAQDELGGTLSVDRAGLQRFSRSWVAATSLVDTTPPSLGGVDRDVWIGNRRPYVYTAGGNAEVRYRVDLSDYQTGFWHGSLTITGPGGATITTDFASQVNNLSRSCGYSYPYDAYEGPCGALVVPPANTAAGTWRVTSVVLVDNAGNTATFGDPGTEPVVFTANQVVSASDFTVTPNPVNNWHESVETRVGMAVHGAQQGVSEIILDLSNVGGHCAQVSTTPTAHPDGTYSVPVRAYQGAARCVAQGLAVVDGAGNAAAYGTQYFGPDPGVTILRLPNTTPPVVTAASVSPATVTQAAASETTITLSVQVTTPIAPVTSYDLYVYDAAGEEVVRQGGGTGAYNGVVEVHFRFYDGAEPGEYTVGFAISDASRLTSRWGMPGFPPVPGGPVTITVTA